MSRCIGSTSIHATCIETQTPGSQRPHHIRHPAHRRRSSRGKGHRRATAVLTEWLTLDDPTPLRQGNNNLFGRLELTRTAAGGDGPAQVVSVLLDHHGARATGEDVGAGTTIEGE